MPSFLAAGHGLPPTPPHVNNGGRLDEPTFYPVGHTAFPPRYHQSGSEFIEQYSQSLISSKPHAMGVYPGSGHAMHGVRDMHSMGHQQPMYGPAATSLPPIRANMQLPPMDNAISSQYRCHDMASTHQLAHQHQHQQHPSQQQQSRKEEKATGGVAAHLDYEMDRMSDFVAEMTQGMYDLYNTKITLSDIDFARSISPGTSVPPQFRKYVYQILSSTRLPSSTILLGLFYMASRMRILSAQRTFHSSSGQIYRMLTVALLLGSKFLDDNTFQNKSWAEVSNIPVAELNKMELEWLFAFDWKIHDRIYDQQDGFASWRRHWDSWSAKANARAHESTRQTLAPLDTNVARHHQTASKPLMSPEGPIPPQYQRGSHTESSWLNPAASEYSPPSAPHSGPNTPDYYPAGPWGFANPPPPYSQGTWIPPPPRYLPQSAPRSQPPSYHHTPAYGLPFAQSVWTGHGSSCGCVYCAKHMEFYMPHGAFPPLHPVIAG
ncbi:Cyclin-like protein Clg1 [Penicillium ucsense]|uniref:Cyclin-like protein Clg1 n=1 Tax=Penicillium ucsense TaxID=2839758 RepID=A0A8J8WGK3_9EURO|nr:Cyclin-like protein Clg1 [Penicillium ucsense]KAF7729101.1 Cyclin-like protein Clg1 [Penicillium ucsense]